MTIIVFRSRIRADADHAAMGAAGARMHQLASAMPGFRSYKEFAADDGETVAIVEFASLEDSTRWRDHTEHRQVQQLGKQRFFSEYRVQVCELVRECSSAQTCGA